MLAFAALWLACAPLRDAEDPSDWFDPGSDLDVAEALRFTDQNYGFGATDGIGDFAASVFPAPDRTIVFGEDDDWPAGSSCDSEISDALPAEIEGIVTITPRYYMKVDGCDGEEKYYGNFFLQDASGGTFVLGDSKVAAFAAGDRVRLRARAVRTNFDFNIVYSWDTVAIHREARPIFYEVATQTLDAGDHSLVRRVTGEVQGKPDTFGAFQVKDDLGTVFDIQIDAELNRRGFTVAPGQRIQVTGPVMYSYSIRAIVVMSLGQVEIL